ncbi:MAG: hypothetical protein AAF152_04910 [Cyanobacteria bacterium P01_A01_bin.114]
MSERFLSDTSLLPEAALLPGSTAPLFASFFEGADFCSSPESGSGLYAAGVEGTTNILIFGDAAGGNDVAVGGDEVDIIMANEGDDNIMGAEGTESPAKLRFFQNWKAGCLQIQ